MATVDVYHKFGLPVIVWGAVLPDITYANDYKEIHRVNGTMINQNETAARFMTGLKFKRWAIIHDTTDYGKGHNRYFSEFLTKNGGQIVGTFGVTADQQDFTAELTKIKERNPEVIYFAAFLRLRERTRQLAGTLSGGEQAMLSIGRGLMASPKLLIVDEPSLGLSPLLVKENFSVIRRVNDLGVTVLLVEQNVKQTLAIAHYGYVLAQGRVVARGTGEELSHNSQVQQAYFGAGGRGGRSPSCARRPNSRDAPERGRSRCTRGVRKCRPIWTRFSSAKTSCG